MKNLSFATQYLGRLRGGSQPILVRASDRLVYVVKFNNNLQGPNLPFNESAGATLYRAFGLASPSWKPLLISGSFVDQNPACWIETSEGRLRPSPGVCFASRFLGGPGIHLFEILPGSSFPRIRNRRSFLLAWLIDICAKHADNRQAIFQQDETGQLNIFFIDHGHMFGGPKGNERAPFQASFYLDSRIYPDVSFSYFTALYKIADLFDADPIWQSMQELPENWKTPSAVENCVRCLDRLSTHHFVQATLDAMIDTLYQDRVNDFELSKQPFHRKPPAAVLRPGVHAAGRQSSATETRLDHFARD